MISLNVAVNAKNVSLKLNNKYIVSKISFEIPKGSITLIKGDN
ncbi:ABC transporter ATP-binding protein, partial [Staphylococcus saprophyticus]